MQSLHFHQNKKSNSKLESFATSDAICRQPFLLQLQVRRQDQFERKNGGGFDAQELEEHPERYVSNFAHKFAPYASVIINGIYWAPNTPRLLTIPDAKALLTPSYSPWIADSKGTD